MSRSVAYFAFNRDDAATRRRVAALRRDGIAVSGFAMRRADREGGGPAPDWLTADLGRTRDNAYLQRLAAIARGVRRTLARRDALAAADVILARNLDMLAIAVAARRLTGLTTPVIYECLDIHRLMVRPGPVGRAFRRAEARLLGRTAALWVSSPAFLTEYFRPVHGEAPPAHLVENRIPPGPGLAPRPVGAEKAPGAEAPLRLGWFGNLRCRRSMALMERLGAAFAERIEIHLRGYPATGEIPDFDARVAAAPAIRYGGRYRAPEDLGDIYGAVDLVWAGDFMDAGFNSAWLLPNRLYEGGWFACPPIAPAAAETGRWIEARGAGFTLPEPLEETLPALIGRLLEDRAPVARARAALLALPDETFAEPDGSMAALIDAALEGGQRRSRP